LGIRTIESITFPRNFQAKSQKDKLKFVERARNEKTEFGVRYDLYSYLKLYGLIVNAFL